MVDKSSLPLPTTTTGRFLYLSHDRLQLIFIFTLVSLFSTLIITRLIVATEYKLHYPYSINAFQLGFGWLAFRFLGPKHVLVSPSTKSILPVVGVYTALLGVKPIFLTHVQTTSYQLFIAFAIPLTFGLSRVMLASKRSSLQQQHILPCLVFCIGSWISTWNSYSPSTSWQGTCLGLVHALLVATYSILVSHTMATVDIGIMIRYITGLGCLGMLVFILLSGEWQGPLPYFWNDLGFWFQMVLSGVLGLGVNILGIMLIRQTSPMTYIMAIGTKSCLQTILAAALFGNPLSNLYAAGIAITLSGAGSFFYITSRQ